MAKQMKLNLFKGKRGGRRPGSGRKRLNSTGISHRKREKVKLQYPLHINFKLKTYIRNKTCLKILKRSIQNARSHGLIISHYSLQTNHIHLLVEAPDNMTLSRGMRSLTITFAKGLNRGKVQYERYHLHVLKTLREIRNAFHYVFFNQQKHSGLKRAHVDIYSSLGWIKDLKKLAIDTNLTIILRKIEEHNFLDQPNGWMLRQVLNHQ